MYSTATRHIQPKSVALGGSSMSAITLVQRTLLSTRFVGILYHPVNILVKFSGVSLVPSRK